MSILRHPSTLPQKGFILIDARVGTNSRANFEMRHLKSARFVDVETDLAQKEKKPAQGGRHPLPSVAEFCACLGRLGITPKSKVIVYDDKNAANAAARFWWMLRALGHEAVWILDGGFPAALAAGFPTSKGAAKTYKQAPYPAEQWNWPTADLEEVDEAAQNAGKVVIDVRDAARFQGLTEPIDLVAGHIPGAVNRPFSENLDDGGFFKTPEQLRALYGPLFEKHAPENIIVHCGSGITACHTLAAFAQAGLPMAKLYVGSWSEWSRNARPIGTGEGR